MLPDTWLLAAAIFLPPVVILIITHHRESVVLRRMVEAWAKDRGYTVHAFKRALFSHIRISTIIRPIVFRIELMDSAGTISTGTAACPNYWFGRSPKELRVELDGNAATRGE